MNWNKFICDIDNDIKLRHPEAPLKLQSVDLSKIPKRYAVEFVELCSRLNLNQLAMRGLRHHLFIRGDFVCDDPYLFISYCRILDKLGASRFALKHLQNSEYEKFLPAMWVLAFANLRVWNHEKSLEYFNRCFLNEVDPYKKMTAKMNILSLQIFLGMYSEVENGVAQVLNEADSNNWLLVANAANEYLALSGLFSGKHQYTRSYLNQYLIKNEKLSPSYTRLKLLLDLTEHGWSSKLKNTLSQLIESYKNTQSWNAIRSLDHWIGVVTHDRKFLTKCYLGSPYKYFRLHLHKVIGDPSMKKLVKARGFNREGDFFDLRQGKGRWKGNQLELKVGHKKHQLLELLLLDDYRPLNIEEVFCELYPSEYYDPNSSPNKLNNLLVELNKWIRDHEIGWSLYRKGRVLHLEPKTNKNLTLCVNMSTHLGEEHEVENLRFDSFLELLKQMNNDAFTTKEVISLTKLSKAHALNLINYGQDKNVLQKVGSGRNSRYILKAS